MNYTGNIKIDTVIRTIVLTIAIINQILAIIGKEKLPIYENDIVQIVTLVITVVSSIWAWWKNNSFTKSAIEADQFLKEKKTYEDENGGV